MGVSRGQDVQNLNGRHRLVTRSVGIVPRGPIYDVEGLYDVFSLIPFP